MLELGSEGIPKNDIDAAFWQSSSTTDIIQNSCGISTESSSVVQPLGLVSRKLLRYRGGVQSIGEGVR
jgi:hypothetical protein